MKKINESNFEDNDFVIVDYNSSTNSIKFNLISNTSNRTLFKSKKIKFDYKVTKDNLYEDETVIELLNSTVKQDIFYICPPLAWGGVNYEYYNEIVNNSRLMALSKTNTGGTILPINTGNHWTVLITTCNMLKNGDLNFQLIYIDPKAVDPEYRYNSDKVDLFSILTNQLENIVEVYNVASTNIIINKKVQQYDGISCGPLLIENVNSFISTVFPLGNRFTEENIDEGIFLHVKEKYVLNYRSKHSEILGEDFSHIIIDPNEELNIYSPLDFSDEF